MFPDIKKRLKSFVISEKGSISKQSVLAIGAFLTGTSLGLVKEVKQVNAGGACGGDNTISLPSTHANSLKVSYDRQNGIVTTIHSHSVSVNSNNLPAKGGGLGGGQSGGQSSGGQSGGQGGQGSNQ